MRWWLKGGEVVVKGRDRGVVAMVIVEAVMFVVAVVVMVVVMMRVMGVVVF